nr:DUF445 domain-containing protein [Variovorax sp. dw_954]
MKRVALALLCGAALLYALSSVMGARYPGAAGGAWGYVAAFSEAAMVGAIADWFAVVALFRHPLGLPIPHTAIIPSNKDRIGAKLAGFICNNFLGTEQVLVKLREFDAAGRLADWLARPASADKLGEWGVLAARYGLSAFDDARVRDFLGNIAKAGIAQLDIARAAGQALEALTAGGRHQTLLNDALAQISELLEGETAQAQITEAIAREVKSLRFVGLDQVAARLGTKKVVSAVARSLAEIAAEPDHPLRARFDGAMANFIARLQHDPAFHERGEEIRAELMAHPALGEYLHGLWDELLGWLREDLGRADSIIGQRIAALTSALGTRLQSDTEIRKWINEQIEAAAPLAIERYREDIRRYIIERVGQWNAHEMTRELEQHIGRDLQFIRVNGTLVGGLVGLVIHAVTHWVRG